MLNRYICNKGFHPKNPIKSTKTQVNQLLFLHTNSIECTQFLHGYENTQIKRWGNNIAHEKRQCQVAGVHQHQRRTAN